MQGNDSMSLSEPRRGSAFRNCVILGALVPAWHSMGMDLFKMNNEVMAVTAHFSRSAMLPYPSAPMAFQATAYCESGITKSGVRTRPGLVAADPAVLPLGSWIHVEGPAEHQGLYQVMDTGRLIKGKIIDIYLPSLEQAVRFGRQKIRVTVLKYGPARRKPVISLN